MNDLEQCLYWYRASKNDMTYILGAKCSDGVVLVGDTKVTIDGGTDSSYGRKITAPLNNIVMGAAGIEGFYMDFQNRVVTEVTNIQRTSGNNHIELTTKAGFSVLVGRVLRDMNDFYERERLVFLNNLRILCAIRINVLKPELYMFNPIGFPEPITQNKVIGGGSPYGKLFLKHIWKSNMSMRKTTKLGLFIIKTIQDKELDITVGFNEEFLPQVYQIPNVPNPNQFSQFPIKELSSSEVNILIEEIEPEISNLNGFLNKFKV